MGNIVTCQNGRPHPHTDYCDNRREQTNVSTTAKWKCKSCGILNLPDFNICGMCGYRQPPEQSADPWCDDCHGYTHMPWCPSYRAVNEISDEEYRAEQPAPEAGEWRYSECSGVVYEVAVPTKIVARYVDPDIGAQIVRDHTLAALVPELVGVLRELDDYYQASGKVWERARAALAHTAEKGVKCAS